MVVPASPASLLRCDHVVALQALRGLGAPGAPVRTLQRVRSLLPGAWEQRPVCVCVVSQPPRVRSCPAAAGLAWFLAWALGPTSLRPWGCSCPSESCGPRGHVARRGAAGSCGASGPVSRTCCASSTVPVTYPWQGTGLLFLHVCANTSCFLFVCVFICIIAILTGVKWYLIAALSIVGHKNGICSVSLEWSQQ